MPSIIDAILAEREAQDKKFGRQDHDDCFWFPILLEEVGESATAILEANREQLEKELVQVAAVAVAWIECMKRRGQ